MNDLKLKIETFFEQFLKIQLKISIITESFLNVTVLIIVRLQR